MSGVLQPSEYPTFDEEHGLLPADDGVEQELDIELNEDEPKFLSGQTAHKLQLSPVKIVRNPDGTLQRAAMTQSALAKERRELKEAQRNTALDAAPKDLHRPWEDPMPEPGERHIAAEIRGLGAAPESQPKWKEALFGKNIRYGQTSKASIKEQVRFVM